MKGKIMTRKGLIPLLELYLLVTAWKLRVVEMHGEEEDDWLPNSDFEYETRLEESLVGVEITNLSLTARLLFGLWLWKLI